MASDAPLHDRFFRSVFSRPEAARDLVREYLPEDVVACLATESLEVTADSLVDDELKAHLSDVVYRVRLAGGGDAWVYVLVEHKSGPDRWVALQLLRYVTALWTRHLREGGGKPLPVVIPLVIYHGRRRWSVPAELAELVQPPQALAPYVPRFRHVLVDLTRLADDEIRGRAATRAAFRAMLHIFDPDLPGRVPSIVRELATVEDRSVL